MSLLGDGATIKGTPFMNILASTPNEPASVLDIVDCTSRMELGEKKDCVYIADLFEEHIQKLDPLGKLIFAVLFDGASNVQKGGRIIEERHPQISCLHGAEHVVSLFFKDVSRLRFVRHLIVNYRRVYRVFGSGSMHAPHAIFMTNSKTFNNGTRLGLLRASETRMAGFFVALHRMLRQQLSLLATLASPEYKGLELKKSVVRKVEAFLNDKQMWKCCYVLIRCLFPALHVLRLADKCTPGMDSLYYFVSRTDSAMARSTAAFREMGYFSTSVGNYPEYEELDEMDDANDDVPAEGGEDGEYDELLEDAMDDPQVSEDDDDDPDDLSNLGLPKGLSGTELGSNIIELWRRRRTKLVSDFAIAGWLLSPLEEVRAHAKQYRDGSHDSAMDRILKKMYHNLTEEELGNVMDTFWTEFDTFVNRTGASYGPGRKFIWNSDLLRQRQSAQWHAQYSLKSTKVCVSFLFLFFKPLVD
jgi:hypothetical protein